MVNISRLKLSWIIFYNYTDEPDYTLAIVLGLFGGLVLVLAIVFCILLLIWCRYRQRERTYTVRMQTDGTLSLEED